MRYIALWEYKDYTPENREKHRAIHNERGEKGAHVNIIFPPHRFLREPKGFIIFETEDEMEIIKYVDDYSSVLKVKIIPIVEGSRISEFYQKLQK